MIYPLRGWTLAQIATAPLDAIRTEARRIVAAAPLGWIAEDDELLTHRAIALGSAILGIPLCYDDVSELLRRHPDPDALFVGTGPYLCCWSADETERPIRGQTAHEALWRALVWVVEGERWQEWASQWPPGLLETRGIAVAEEDPLTPQPDPADWSQTLALLARGPETYGPHDVDALAASLHRLLSPSSVVARLTSALLDAVDGSEPEGWRELALEAAGLLGDEGIQGRVEEIGRARR